MRFSRRHFLHYAAVAAAVTSPLHHLGSNMARAAAQQRLSQDDLLTFDARGSITLLHITDIHAQLQPIFYRPPDTHIGVGDAAGIPPHLVGPRFLDHFGIPAGSALAHAHTMVDYVHLARAYGRMGGIDRIATLVKAIRAERGESNVLLLDGGDTWQGSYTALQTGAQDMLDCFALLKPDAMTGHWEFTLGSARVLELVEQMQYPFLAGNVVDTDWEEPVFESTVLRDVGGTRVAIIGQAMPYTPIANPHWLFPEWSFGLRTRRLAANVARARRDGAEVVVLLSHDGFDVDRKLAGVVPGIDVILTGHTHDAIPHAIRIGSTLLLASGSHGKFLGRVDLEVRNGRVSDYRSSLIPVFADVIEPDVPMAKAVAAVRAPHERELSRVIGHTDALLYRRGNFNGSWDDLICEALMAERDAELSLSPGFRWGTTLLPDSAITVEDLYAQTAMSYPSVYRREFSGAEIRQLLEDVCDNLFNPDPFLQQGGDMVRVGGLRYACNPHAAMGSRISGMTVQATGEPIDPSRRYVVAGWASIDEAVEGPAIFDVMETWLSSQASVSPDTGSVVDIIQP